MVACAYYRSTTSNPLGIQDLGNPTKILLPVIASFVLRLFSKVSPSDERLTTRWRALKTRHIGHIRTSIASRASATRRSLFLPLAVQLPAASLSNIFHLVRAYAQLQLFRQSLQLLGTSRKFPGHSRPKRPCNRTICAARLKTEIINPLHCPSLCQKFAQVPFVRDATATSLSILMTLRQLVLLMSGIEPWFEIIATAFHRADTESVNSQRLEIFRSTDHRSSHPAFGLQRNKHTSTFHCRIGSLHNTAVYWMEENSGAIHVSQL